MHVPSIRDITILVHPAILTDPPSDPRGAQGIPRWAQLKVLTNYLARLDEGIGLQFLIPADQLGSEQARNFTFFLPPTRLVALRSDNSAMPYFPGCTATHSHLVALATQEHAHLLLTEDPVLLDQCSPNRLNPPALAVSWDRMLDVIETQLLGHGVYHSFNSNAQGQWLDTFFQSTHPTNRWLVHVFSSVCGSCDANARELLRSLAFNRYPFIIFARGLIHSYRWQSLWYRRQGIQKLHGFVTTFYLNYVYLLMWGTLDHLCLLLNSVHDYGLPERQCGVQNPAFIRTFRQRDPELAALLDSERVASFIGLLAAMRHAAAHRVLPMPTSILTETDESAAPEESLRADLAPELDEELPDLDPKLRDQLLEQRVQMRRIERMRTLTEGAVYVRRDEDGFVYHPYISLDHDIDCLNEVIRAFITACFSSSDG